MGTFRKRLALTAAASLISATQAAARGHDVPSIVIVHGAFADAGGWQAVYDILHVDGYNVVLVQPPMTSLGADVEAARQVIDRQPGPVLLVGHSYGGAIITEAGADPNVDGLFYVAAVQPDTGESMLSLLKSVPEPTNDIEQDSDGFLTIRQDRFVADFAADVPRTEAEFLARSQMPVAAAALAAPVTSPAWRTKPSWCVVATQDREISPALERSMAERAGSTTYMLRSSHAAYQAHPQAIAYLIESAAQQLHR